LINGNEKLKSKISEIGVFSISISNVTLAELYFGAYKSKRVDANIERIREFKRNLTVYSDSDASAKVFGQFKSKLMSEGKVIEDFDILIASIAYTNNCVLVTNNPDHFIRIHKLKVENWFE
jgi:tRNA(fMet)-specific endonuclease VapC